MNYTTILGKGKDMFMWIYKNFTNKFTTLFQKLKDRFPVIDKNPLLKYGLIPLLAALFFLFRYIIKLVISKLTTWTSDYLGETAGYSISEKTIVLSIVAVFIMLRIILKFSSQKKGKANELNLDLERTK